jgi:hypothetical protein
VGYAPGWPFWVLLLLLFVWVVVNLRPRRGPGAWGYGAQYGGPEFGIPVDYWPRAAPPATARRRKWRVRRDRGAG